MIGRSTRIFSAVVEVVECGGGGGGGSGVRRKSEEGGGGVDVTHH